MSDKPFETQKQAIRKLNSYFIRICGVVIVLFVVMQFFFLATMGTKGAEIASIRQQKEDLRIQNEYIRSEIDKAKTTSNIQAGLSDAFQLEDKQVNVIYHYTSSGDAVGSAVQVR